MNIAELKNASLSFDTAELRNITVEGKSTPEEDKFAVYNIEQDCVASIVSDRYNLVQHKQVSDAVVETISNLNLKADAKVKESKNRLFVDLSFNDKTLSLPTKESVRAGIHKKDEEFVVGLRIINSYDKTTGIAVLPRLVRVACNNGMIVDIGAKAYVKSFTIYHTNKLTEAFNDVIQKMIHEMVESIPKLKLLVDSCMEDSIEYQTMKKIIAGLVANRDKHITEILLNLEKEGKVSRWSLYNAFTNYATHGKQLKPSIEEWLQNKAQTILTTPLIQLVPKEEEVE